MYLEISQDFGFWAYLLLAILVMIEGPVATLAGAVAASAGWMKPGWVFVAAATGNLLSDILWYTLGYLGKMEWLHRYGGWFGVREVYIHRFNRDIHAHGAKLLFIAKLTLGFTIPALVATGLARLPFRRWLWALILAETLWTGTLVFLGLNFGRYLQRLEKSVEVMALIGTLLFVAVLLFYISTIRRRSASKPDTE